MHVGVAHHLGWAVLVTATSEHLVIDRRRVELIGDGLPSAPIHQYSGVHPMHDSGRTLDDSALEALSAEVRASATQHVARVFDALVGELGRSVDSFSLREWSSDFPTDISTLRRAPYESRADSVMYRQVMAEQAARRGWVTKYFDANTIQQSAARLLDGDDVIERQRQVLGPPWNKDHRIAFAATIVAARSHARPTGDHTGP